MQENQNELSTEVPVVQEIPAEPKKKSKLKIYILSVLLLFVALFTLAVWGSDSCVYTDTQDRSDTRKLTRVLQAIDGGKYDNKKDDIEAVLKSFTTTEQDMTKRQYARIDPVAIEEVYAKYCVDQTSKKNTNFSTEVYFESLGSLVCKLDSADLSNETIGRDIAEIGFKLNLAGDIDKGIEFYTCAADIYDNPHAEYRMAQVYRYGTETTKKISPDAVIKNEIQPDTKAAYMYVVKYLTGIKNASKEYREKYFQMTYNVIGMLDSIEQELETAEGKID